MAKKPNIKQKRYSNKFNKNFKNSPYQKKKKSLKSKQTDAKVSNIQLWYEAMKSSVKGFALTSDQIRGLQMT